MRNIFILLLLASVSIGAFAQTPEKITLNENTIITDGDGGVIPYALWRGYLNSGEYAVKKIEQNGKDVLVLFKLSNEQIIAKKERDEKIKSNMPKPKASAAFIEGTKFNFTKLKDINGNKYDFKTDTGKIVVFNFWFINCPPCKAEIPELNELVVKYKDRKDIVFIGIALDDEYDLKIFQSNMPFLYNIIPNGRYISEKHNVKSYPTNLIVGKDQLIKLSSSGYGRNTVYWIDKVLNSL